MKIQSRAVFRWFIITFLIVSPITGSLAAEETPKYFTIGPGNFAAINIDAENCLVAHMPYNNPSYQNPEERIYRLIKAKDATGKLTVRLEPVAFELKHPKIEMIDCDPSVRQLVEDEFEVGRITYESWRVANIDGKRIIVSNSPFISPDKTKLILNPINKKELFIYNAITDRIKVTCINKKYPNVFIDKQDFGIIWFGHVYWSIDGEKIAFDTANTGSVTGKRGTSIEVVDEYDNNILIADQSKKRISLLLGWDNRSNLVVNCDDEIGIFKMKGLYDPIVNDVFQASLISTNGKYLIVNKSINRRLGNEIYLVDLTSKKMVPIREKIRGHRAQFTWSPSGSKIAYYISNETYTQVAVLSIKTDNTYNLAYYCPNEVKFQPDSSLSWCGNNFAIGGSADMSCIGFEVD